METEQLISEIERRPGIYDAGCPQYQDRVAKWALWCEVCEAMTPRWCAFDEDRKASRVKELQKRWKSLRDSFMKELKLQRELQRTGQQASRKKYVFFDQMVFLMPCLEARGSLRPSMMTRDDPYESETDSSKAERDSGEQGADHGVSEDDIPVNLSTSLSANGHSELNALDPQRPHLPPHLVHCYPERKYRADLKRRRTTYEEEEEDPDGDRLFLLSLVPSLRSLRGAAKSALKIELAQLVHKTLYDPDDALADSMTESLAPVVSLAEGGSPASSTQSDCTCGIGAKCTCRFKIIKSHGVDCTNSNGLPQKIYGT